MSRFDRWIHRSFPLSARSLGIYRILWSVGMLAALVEEARWVSHFPDAFFAPPPGPMVLLGGFPPGWVLTLVTAGLYASLVLVGLGWRTRATTLTAVALMLYGNAFAYSLGKINHGMLLVAVPALMALAGWGDDLSVDSARSRRSGAASRAPARWPVTMLALVTATMMASAALPKIRTGWLDPGTQAALGHALRNDVQTGADNWLTDALLRVEPAALLEVLDWGTVAVELALFPALLWPRAFKTVLATAVLFHLGVLLILEIGFAANVLAYGAFVAWDRVPGTDALQAHARSVVELAARRRWIVALAVIALTAVAMAVGEPLLVAAVDAVGLHGEWWVDLTIIAGGSIAAAVHIVRTGRSLVVAGMATLRPSTAGA